MSLISLIAALLLEQFRPLGPNSVVYRVLTRHAQWLERNLNAGRFRHGVIAWLLGALLPAVLVWGIYFGLGYFNPIAALVWNVLILYLTMGFRQFSHAFNSISEHLKEDQLEAARIQLSGWTGFHTKQLELNEVARVTIERGLTDSYRHVFAPIFWFVLLPGPAGALLYRLSMIFEEKWKARDDQFGRFSSQVIFYLDWIPVRLTAASFAIMGDFEDAVNCWKHQAKTWENYAYGILLASGAGAIGVLVGQPLHQDDVLKYRPEIGLGDEADAHALGRAVGLIWRAVLLWLVVILALSLMRWF